MSTSVGINIIVCIPLTFVWLISTLNPSRLTDTSCLCYLMSNMMLWWKTRRCFIIIHIDTRHAHNTYFELENIDRHDKQPHECGDIMLLQYCLFTQYYDVSLDCYRIIMQMVLILSCNTLLGRRWYVEVLLEKGEICNFGWDNDMRLRSGRYVPSAMGRMYTEENTSGGWYATSARRLR